MVTQSQTNLLVGIALGALLSFFGNYLITIHFSQIILQLEPRLIFDIMGLVGSIITIVVVFRVVTLPNELRNGIAGFTIPLSIIDFVYLFHNIIQVVPTS